MMPENRECGIRHKFVVKTRDLLPNVYPQEMERLIHWCGVFDAEGMAPVEGGASAGNLSFRSPSGYVITPTRSRLKANLSWKDFIEVVRENWLDYEVHVLGERAPSSDAFLHGRIYARRPDVMAVYHGHDELVLRHADAISRHFDIADPGRALGRHRRQHQRHAGANIRAAHMLAAKPAGADHACIDRRAAFFRFGA